MHGRVKVKTTAQQEAEKEKERAKKLLHYNTAMKQTFEKRKAGQFDTEALVLTSNLLLANPDIYTIWNVRKEILLFQKHQEATSFQSVMNNELTFTETCLRVNPKSYGAWQHRIWVLDEMPEPDWNRELQLCNKYLDLDERNFHCWDYRYFVVRRANVSPEKELEFTDGKINQNFSNYSSWHYRSKLLPHLYPDPEILRPLREERLLQEFDLVQNAAFTDPNDQSAWFYHRWLLGRSEIHLHINFLYVSRKNYVILVFSKPAGREIINSTTVSINNVVSEIKWLALAGNEEYSPAWVAEALDFNFSNFIGDIHLEVKILNHTPVSQMICIMRAGENECWVERASRWKDFSMELTVATSSVLQQELDSCLQLLELEPDSKWPLLTTVFLMRNLNFTKFKDAIMENLEKLMAADPLRKGYYLDLRSKFCIEHIIEHLTSGQLELSLNGLHLSTLYHPEYFVHLKNLDISNNNLRSVVAIAFLRFMEILNLDDNEINSCEGLQNLRELKHLSIQRNKIESFDSIKSLVYCKCLKYLSLRENPISCQEDYKEKTLLMLPTVEVVDY